MEKMIKEYANCVIEEIEKSDFSMLAKIGDVILKTKETHATIYTVGNGGSAATASHICNDLLKGCGVCGRPGFKTECLADSNAIMTCLGNDFDYESIFSIQLKAKAVKGDVLIAFSGSGNSENVIRAVKLAKEMGVTVVGFTGRDGGKLAPLCDYVLIAPTQSMERIEDLHMLYAHAMCSTIAKVLTEKYSRE